MRLGVGACPLTGPPPARVPCAGLECLGRAETWCPRGTGERRSRRSPLVLGGPDYEVLDPRARREARRE
ncbi:hypothetical protein NDU88_008850 [Pleurodeles waltl]|uniref:Uncharacterized protein n=1 Tax=Pleurodeles waltl TaxID=8319 RepID=A0AAV7NAY0_PLEWA|nr:hypothetical protein NDU88_008850 [Pleurodeles waltl]